MRLPNKSLHRAAAQLPRFGCAGMIGRRIHCRRPWSAAVGELTSEVIHHAALTATDPGVA